MNKSFSKLVTKINTIKSIVSRKEEKLSNLSNSRANNKIDPQHIIVLFYFIGLTARCAEIDSPTKPRELETLIELFPNFLNASNKVTNLYNSALLDQTPALNFAHKIKTLYPQNKLLMKQILEYLIKIADCDAPINTSEYVFINNIANEFGFESGTVDELIETYFFEDNRSPYEILGVNEKSSLKDINTAYKAKIVQFHPDKLHANKDIALAYKNTFEKKYQEVSKAYNTLLHMRD